MNTLLLIAQNESNPMWLSVKPILTQLGFGGIAGLCVGFMFKKTLKLAAIIFALIFIVIQVLVSMGYIGDVNWMRISQDFTSAFDKSFFDGLWRLASHHFPFAGGLGVGFLIGFKAG